MSQPNNKKSTLNGVGSNSNSTSQVLADKKKIIADMPYKNARGKRTLTIKNTDTYDRYVAVMFNPENGAGYANIDAVGTNIGQYAALTTVGASSAVLPLQGADGNGVSYSCAHPAGVVGFREALRKIEAGFVGVTFDCTDDTYVDQFGEECKYSWIGASLDGKTDFPLNTKIDEAKSLSSFEKQIRVIEFGGVLNQQNDLVFILKAGRTLKITFDVAHVQRAMK